MFMLDWYAHNSRIKNVHPGEKVVFVGLCLGLSLFFSRETVSLAIILLLSAIILFYLDIPLRFYLKLLTLPLTFLLPGCLAVALEIPAATPAAGMLILPLGPFSLGFSSAGISLAANLLLRSLAALCALYFLALTTSFDQLGWLLRKAKLPPTVVELAALTYRFIFILNDTALSIYTAQATRLGYACRRNTMKSLGSLAAGLLFKSFYRSQMMHTGLLSRCYEGTFHTLETHFSISPCNWLMICGTVTALLAIAQLSL